MSRSVQQYIWGAAILAIALVFVMQFRPGAQFQGADAAAEPTCAAEVDGRCIVSQSDYVTAFRLVGSGNVDDDNRRDLVRQLVLEGLVQRWLLAEDAARLGIAVSEEDVSQSLGRSLVRVSLPADHENDMLAYQLGLSQPDGAARSVPFTDPKKGKFDYERYKKWVQRISGKTLQDFREFAAKEELAARMRALVKSRARVADEEAHAEFAVGSAKIVVDYVQLSRDWYQRRVDASPGAVATWAADHAKDVDEAWAEKKDEYLPTCRKVRHIFARIDDSGDKAAATKKAKEKLDAAKARLDAGEAFGDVARLLSEDSQSASSGGALGCFAAGKLARPNTAKAVDDAAFALKKGGVSNAVESTFGLHLVTVDAIFDGDAAEKEGRAELARARYLKEEGERRAAEAAKEILATVKGGKTLQQAVDGHLTGLAKLAPKPLAGKAPPSIGTDDSDAPKVATSGEFTMAGPPFPGVESPLQSAGALFALDVGGVSPEPIKMYTGYAVAQVKEKKALDPKDWEEKRDRLIDTLRRDKERDALVRYVHALREKYAKTITYKLKDERRKKDAKADGPKASDSAEPGEAPPAE